MKVGIVGSRNFQGFSIDQMKRYVPENCTAIISGGARGIDSLAQELAIIIGVPFECYCPDYQKYGKNATLIRNQKIVERSSQVLAFWDFHSRGTAYTIAKCIEKQVPVKIIGLDQI